MTVVVSVTDTMLNAHDVGLCVVPPREDGTKAPVIEYLARADLMSLIGADAAERLLDGRAGAKTWKHWHYQRPRRTQVERWARGSMGVGLVTGSISGGLKLFEFDDAYTFDQYRDAAPASGLGPLLDRVIDGYLESTPSDGFHILYFCEEVRPSTKLAKASATTVLIETKGEGGYVVIAPSHGRVHPTEKPYMLLSGGIEQIVSITPTERDALWELARAFDRMPEPITAPANTTTPATGTRPGDDFNRNGPDWADLLTRHGWAHVYDRGQTQFWRRPGKHEGVSATINGPSVGANRLYVFSTSTTFEAGQTLSPWSAV